MTQIIYSTRAYILVAENHTATISSATERNTLRTFQFARIEFRSEYLSCVCACVWVWCYSYCSLPCCRPANYSCNQAFESHNNWHATVTTAATTRVKWFLDKSKIYNNNNKIHHTSKRNPYGTYSQAGTDRFHIIFWNFCSDQRWLSYYFCRQYPLSMPERVRWWGYLSCSI